MRALLLLLLPGLAAAQAVVPLHFLDALVGEAPGARLGLAHAVGDVDCDGRADLLVSSAEPAAVYVFKGAADAPDPWPGPAWPDRLVASDADLRIDGPATFGAALAVGDLGAACDSLVVGAPGLLADPGAAYVFHAPLDTDCEGSCALDASGFSVRIDGLPLGRLGTAVVVAGDLDDRGHDDLVLGEPAFSLSPGDDANQGHALVFGHDLDGLDGVVLPSLAADLVVEGVPGQRVGARLQADDVDGDGRDELLLPGGGDLLLLHDLQGLGPLVAYDDLATQLLRHHGHLLDVDLPVAVHGGPPADRVIWAGETSWFFGVGAAVALRADSQGRFDQSRAQSAVRIEGVIGADGFLGAWIDGADVDGDGVRDLTLVSPLWSDGDGTVQDSVGPRAGMTRVVDGAALPALFEQVCEPAPCGYVVDSVAAFSLRGTQGYEGAAANAGVVEPTSVRATAAADRVWVFSPLVDDPIVGLDAGAVRGLPVDPDGDGARLGADCGPFDPTVFPGAEPVCDGVPDQDCDGVVDEAERDRDGDGFSPCDGDCDDEDARRAPGLDEVWCDGVDNDCVTAAEDAAERDGDGDGWFPCTGDCDDGAPARRPGAPELCNGLDDDCDGAVDEDHDQDGDGYPDAEEPGCADRPARTLDCDDADPLVHPGAAEGGAFLDSDCDGGVAWRGGCACSSGGDDRSGAALLLGLLGLFCLRRPRRELTPAPRPPALLVLVAAPLLMGQARLLPLSDADLLLVGSGSVEIPFAIAATPDAVVVSDPFASRGIWPLQGATWELDGDDLVPRLLVLDDGLHHAPTNLFARYAGWSLASGDLDGDGLLDHAVGVPATGGPLDAGRVAVRLGCGDGFCPGKVFEPGTTWAPGVSLSFADLDGDGFDELLVGDGEGRGAQNVFGPVAGNTWILWGRPDLAPEDPPADISRLEGDPARPVGALVRGEADWTCDGLPDLLVGCDPAHGGCSADELLVVVNPGADGGSHPWRSSLGLGDAGPRLAITGVNSSVRVGVRALPDLDSDGCDDVLLGLPDQGEGAGLVAIVRVSPGASWLSEEETAVSLEDLAPTRLVGAEGEGLGGVEVVAWTDPSLPWPDLLLGAPGGLSGLAPEHRPGRVAFLRGDRVFAPGGPLAEPGERLVWDVADVVLEGESGGDEVGDLVTLGPDLDGDGARDVLVGAPALDHPDGGVDAGGVYVVGSALFRDLDGDGATGLDDCDDSLPTCVDAATDCVDVDGDGVIACAGDCDDLDASVHPDRNPREVAEREDACDGVDDDCDGALRPDELDEDGDGVLACSGDCDDRAASVAPGFPELCNGLDDDCDGRVDEEHDQDADGVPAGADCVGVTPLDCDDRARDTWPGAPEVPGDGRDQDCDGEDATSWRGGLACAASPAAPSPLWLLALLPLARRRRRAP